MRIADAATFVGAAAEGGPDHPGPLGALILGIVEGLTEFLPISSTGHLIVANRLLGDADGDATFEVVIQVGAISAIAWLYRDKLWRALLRLGGGGAGDGENVGRTNLLVTLIVAALPAIVLGLAFDDLIEELLFGPTTVAVTMVAGGVALLALEAWLARRTGDGDGAAGGGRVRMDSVEAIGTRTALAIGMFQCLALIPGTSRSGATIAGALLLGCGRGAAAEFSFLVGLPILYGAGAYKVLQDHERVFGPLALDLCIGIVASFLTALWIVGPFVRYVRGHTFAPFAWYRIVAGIALGAVLGAGLL